MTMILMLLAISCGQSFQQDSKEKLVVTSLSHKNENELIINAYLIIPKGQNAACLARLNDVQESDLSGLNSLSNTSHLNREAFITPYAVSEASLKQVMGLSNGNDEEVAGAVVGAGMVGAGAIATTQTGGSGGSSSYDDDNSTHDEGTWRHRSNRNERSYPRYSQNSSSNFNNIFIHTSSTNSRTKYYSLHDFFSRDQVSSKTSKKHQEIEPTKLSPVQTLVNLKEEQKELLEKLAQAQRFTYTTISNFYADAVALANIKDVMRKLSVRSIPIVDDPEGLNKFLEHGENIEDKDVLEFILKQQKYDHPIDVDNAQSFIGSYIIRLEEIIKTQYNSRINDAEKQVHPNLPQLIRQGSVPLAESYAKNPIITAIVITVTGAASTIALYHGFKWIESLIKHKEPKAAAEPALSLTEQSQNQEPKAQYMSLSPHIEEDTLRSLILALPPVEPQIPCF